MSSFDIKLEWLSTSTDSVEDSATMAMLTLLAGDKNLTQNEDIWSKSVRDNVRVSAYPLAMWVANSWWRLMWEPLPAHHKPSISWRMAHELGAANHGFVWPHIVFASDNDSVQVWAALSDTGKGQSVRYLNSLDSAFSVPVSSFKNSLSQFVEFTVARLIDSGRRSSDLVELWTVLQDEMKCLESSRYRQFEAVLGYDPDECPPEIMAKIFDLNDQMGEETLSELAPVYGNPDSDKTSIFDIDRLVTAPGFIGLPSLPVNPAKDSKRTTSPPWQVAVSDARWLRRELGNVAGRIDNHQMYDLLGISSKDVESWRSVGGLSAISMPVGNGRKYIPRKKNPVGKRFELARFLGDLIYSEQSKVDWLACTDLSTHRQKYQRAFAAEFLCPSDELKGFLNGDDLDESIESAAAKFDVSQTMVNSILANHGLITSPLPDAYGLRLPY